jgi:hypothetical protein
MTAPDMDLGDVVACLVCGGPLNVHYMGFVVRKHDHKPDQSGLDDGPYLPHQAPRKKRVASPDDVSAERRRAWKTRRAMYGPRGHR